MHILFFLILMSLVGMNLPAGKKPVGTFFWIALIVNLFLMVLCSLDWLRMYRDEDWRLRLLIPCLMLAFLFGIAAHTFWGLGLARNLPEDPDGRREAVQRLSRRLWSPLFAVPFLLAGSAQADKWLCRNPTFTQHFTFRASSPARCILNGKDLGPCPVTLDLHEMERHLLPYKKPPPLPGFSGYQFSGEIQTPDPGKGERKNIFYLRLPKGRELIRGILEIELVSADGRVGSIQKEPLTSRRGRRHIISTAYYRADLWAQTSP